MQRLPQALADHFQAPEFLSFHSGELLKRRSVSPVILTALLDVPTPPSKLTADWARDMALQLDLQPGEVEPLPLARTRARWPDYQRCVQAMADWTRTLGLGDVLDESELALMACRGANYHDDAARYSGSAFCNLFLSEDCGLDLHFPGTGQRVALTKGTAVIFDTGQPHAVIQRGSQGFNEPDFAKDPLLALVFLTWELPIDNAGVAGILHIAFDLEP